MNVAEVMTPNVSTIAPGATLADACRRMRDLNVGALPVVEGHELNGIITDRDIVVRAGAEHWNLGRKLVSDAMSPSVVCCRDTDTLEDAAHAMEDAQIRRLPVKNRAGELVGIVSLGDVALRASHELTGEALEAVSRHGEMAEAG